MWSEKYRPKNILDLVGNEEARKSLVEWFTKWKKGTKPILLIGPPGIGKTTLINIILGLMQPTNGSIHVDGINIFENSG